MLMVMEILHPVHWTVRAFVDPADLRQMAWMVLKSPRLILKAIGFLFTKNPVYPPLETGDTQSAAATGPKTGPIEVPTRPPAAGPGPIPAARPGPGPIPSRRVSS
jgi:hypothetical protein